VGSVVVVDVAELVELVLERGEAGGEGLAAQPSFEGLLEPFDLSGGLGVVWASGEGAHSGVAQVVFEQHFHAAQSTGEAQPVVRQHTDGQTPHGGCLAERGPRLRAGGLGDRSRGDRYSGVVIDDVEDPHDPGGDHPVGCVDLPPLVRGGRLEALP